jgi:DNA (cytosine-5)-methyltransferase 1
MSRIKRIPHDGGSRMALGEADQLECHKRRKNNGFRDIYGRMSWDDVAPTLTRFCCNPSKGRFLHPDQDRAITPYEAALLQTFPRSYKFPVELGRGAICSMIGEAFPPLMGKRQAEYLRKHIESYA